MTLTAEEELRRLESRASWATAASFHQLAPGHFALLVTPPTARPLAQRHILLARQDYILNLRTRYRYPRRPFAYARCIPIPQPLVEKLRRLDHDPI